MTNKLLHHATHAAHATHASHTTHAAGRTLLLGSLNDGNLGGTQKRGDTAGVKETGADDLQGVDDTGIDHVDVLALGGIVALAEVGAELVHELANNDGALKTGVLDDRPGRAGDGVLDDADTELLVEVGRLDVAQGLAGSLEQSGTTTGQDTLLDGGAGGVKGIDEAVLLLTDLDLRRAADLDDGNTARELGQTLLELLLLVLRGGWVSHNTTDLLAPLGDHVLAALAVKDNGVLLGDGDGSGGAEHVNGSLLQLDVKLISEDGTVGENSNVAKDRLAVVTEAGGLDGSDLELAAELVQNADSQSLALNVLGDDDKRPAGLGRDLKGGDDNQGLLELNLLSLGIGDEVRRHEAAVEPHTLGNLELVNQGLALLDGDDTLLADLLHGVGNHLADVHVAVGRDGGDLGNLLSAGDVAFLLVQELDDGVDGSLDTAAEIHGVAASGNVLDGLGEDGASEDSGRGGTVTGDLVGLGRDVLEELGTKVLELVLEGNGLCDGHTI
ncbi:hypothetical protein PoMZ_08013 [Pyricularia oryzae]|uniref:NAD-specific glutamate dehydrogenase n=1 Tax=Pyricularia oryzae TaxID=318829 RepID=A0A4P7NGJ9_PYROR|nr:hypothetical protein PoMZ_08013 [Pyricularia oryzae]